MRRILASILGLLIGANGLCMVAAPFSCQPPLRPRLWLRLQPSSLVPKPFGS